MLRVFFLTKSFIFGMEPPDEADDAEDESEESWITARHNSSVESLIDSVGGKGGGLELFRSSLGL